MRLIVDANVIVGKILRPRGQALVTGARLKLRIAERARDEARPEPPRRARKRVAHRRMGPIAGEGLLATAFSTFDLWDAIIPEGADIGLEAEARRRASRDPDDWPTIAAALTTASGIWTNDGDFLGCGLPTWTTETKSAYLQHIDAALESS